jgi:hypothetical protein
MIGGRHHESRGDAGKFRMNCASQMLQSFDDTRSWSIQGIGRDVAELLRTDR